MYSLEIVKLHPSFLKRSTFVSMRRKSLGISGSLSALISFSLQQKVLSGIQNENPNHSSEAFSVQDCVFGKY